MGLLNTYFYSHAGICETGYKGANCDQCDTGYFGDGAICASCGTHKTTPPSGIAVAAADCKFSFLFLVLVQ